MLIRYGTNARGSLIKKACVYTKDEHHILKDKIDSDALRIIHRLREAGFLAYLVGGAVRDLLIGKTPKDFDIATDATPAKIKRLFHNARIIGKRFRLVHVLFGSKIFEVSTFRSISEGSVGNNFGTIDEDALRRDFSLNALYYDPLAEQVIDYVGGFRDIKKHVVRNVIPIEKIFTEDPVRMIRAVKYSALTGFRLLFSVKRAIKANAHLLENVSASRLTEELLKIINSGHMKEIVERMIENDLYLYLQPEASLLIDENKTYKKNYLLSLKKIDELFGKEVRLGEKLRYFIFDFANALTDWQKEKEAKTPAAELYAKTWYACRHFVLPMNPQRSELEFAIRSILQSFGFVSKKRKKTFPPN